jgi:hypothetical protein
MILSTELNEQFAALGNRIYGSAFCALLWGEHLKPADINTLRKIR